LHNPALGLVPKKISKGQQKNIAELFHKIMTKPKFTTAKVRKKGIEFIQSSLLPSFCQSASRRIDNKNYPQDRIIKTKEREQ